MNTQEAIQAELRTYWSKAKYRAGKGDICELHEVINEASGLIDFEACGVTVVIKPSSQLFGPTGHKPIVLEEPGAVSFFWALVDANEEGA